MKHYRLLGKRLPRARLLALAVLSASVGLSVTIMTSAILTGKMESWSAPDSSSLAAIEPAQATTCGSDGLRLAVKLPTGWSCDAGEYWLTLRSDLFTIEISNLGRGPVCPNPNPDCVASPFFADSTVQLTMWTVKGRDTEIFGSLKSAPVGLTWISAHYQGMPDRKLTAAERGELITVLHGLRQNR